jgi:hypothetical protein
MTDLDERVPLTETGVNVLLVYGAKLFPPQNGKPGIRVTVDGKGGCLLEAVGYPCMTTADEALQEAGRTCIDAGLIVTALPKWLMNLRRDRHVGPGLVVRKRAPARREP